MYQVGNKHYYQIDEKISKYILSSYDLWMIIRINYVTILGISVLHKNFVSANFQFMF